MHCSIAYPAAIHANQVSLATRIPTAVTLVAKMATAMTECPVPMMLVSAERRSTATTRSSTAAGVAVEDRDVTSPASVTVDGSFGGSTDWAFVGLEIVAVECSVDADCDDGKFCNGTETCVGGSCQSGGDPCPGQGCDEGSDACVSCSGNKASCSVNGDCCSGNCKDGTCKGN